MDYKIKKLKYNNSDLCFSFIKNEPYFKKFKNLNGWSKKSIESFLKSKNSLAYGCYNSNNLIGFIFCNNFVFAKTSEIELLLIFVQKTYRRLEIGKSLINFILKKQNKQNLINIYLEFSESNIIAKYFYENCGFINISVRKDYYVLSNGFKENAKSYKKTIKKIF